MLRLFFYQKFIDDIHVYYIGCPILNDAPEYLGNEIRYEFRSCDSLLTNNEWNLNGFDNESIISFKLLELKKILKDKDLSTTDNKANWQVDW